MEGNELSEADFIRQVTEFVNVYSDGWSLHKTNCGVIAKQSAICRYDNNLIINRQSQFIYNQKLGRLELWFMFYCRSGQPLRVKEISTILGTNPEINDAIVIERAIHPTLNIPFYKLYKNPEDSTDLMGQFDVSNYIVRWIMAYGAEAGLVISNKKIANEGVEISSSSSHSLTSADDS